MFDADKRPLPFPLDRASNLEVVVPDDTDVCGIPEFPEDSDEKITVLFRLSLNDFVALATAIDVGSDIAYGDDGLKIWYLWVASVMCAQFCEEMALCLETENPTVVAALANLIRNNQQIIQSISESITNAGSGIPGQPLSDAQANEDTLPENVRDEEGECVYNALWGACLFLVQSGNRLITDFFEKLESASNTLETSAIVAETIPAAGPYVSAAAQFADQLQETLAEGYAAAYTEEYEEQLACALFCLARGGCELTPDMLVDSIANRLGYVDGTENFGVLMARVGTGVFVGSSIADAMFYIYFSALRFGQQFLDQIGIRPMTELMGLGADQLASDNWETLCDCPEEWIYDFPDGDGWNMWSFPAFAGAVSHVDGDVVVGSEDSPTNDANFLNMEIMADGDVNHVAFDVSWVDAGSGNAVIIYQDDVQVAMITPTGSGSATIEWNGTATGSHVWRLLIGINGGTTVTRHTECSAVHFAGDGVNPFV